MRRWGVWGVLGLSWLWGAQATTQTVGRWLWEAGALAQPVSQAPAWSWLIWQAQFYALDPARWNRLYLIWLLGLGGSLLGATLLNGFINRQASPDGSVHGTAHWASQTEIQASGLLSAKGRSQGGVYVGGWQDASGRVHYLRHNGPEHIAALAPTRSGKGVGLVIPTLLSWPASVVVNDMKGELWALTAGWRQAYAQNVVLKFDPAAATGSCAFNPLGEIRLGSQHEVGDVQNLVTILVDPDGKGLVDHWAKTAHALLTGLVLHLLYANNGNASLADVARALSDPARPVNDLYQAMLENHHQQGQAHPVVAAAARDMLNRPDDERASVLSSAMSYLSIYRDPLVAHNTRHSDFGISDLMDYERPVSLYLVVRPADKDRLKPLMRLLINQIVRVLVREELTFVEGQAQPVHTHRLLLMLDEFPSYGRLEVFQ